MFHPKNLDRGTYWGSCFTNNASCFFIHICFWTRKKNSSRVWNGLSTNVRLLSQKCCVSACDNNFRELQRNVPQLIYQHNSILCEDWVWKFDIMQFSQCVSIWKSWSRRFGSKVEKRLLFANQDPLIEVLRYPCDKICRCRVVNRFGHLY